MKCTPDECPYCEPWGPAAPGKAKCCKPPLKHDPRPEYAYSNGWRYSTTLGGSCVTPDKHPGQDALFDMDEAVECYDIEGEDT